MPIQFNQIPLSILVPGAYAEVDPSAARQGAAVEPKRVIFLGQKISGGSATNLTPYLVSSATQAAELFGQGTPIHHMIARFKENNSVTETWAMSMAEDGSGVVAAGDFTFTGTATKAGVVYAYIGGRRVLAPVAVGDGAADVAASLTAAISADGDSYVTAATDSTTTDVTSKWKGASANKVDLRLNYYPGEALPEGITCVVTQMSSGAADPDVGTAIAAMGSETQYTTWVMPFVDTANLVDLETELEARWSPPRSIPGIAFAANVDSYANNASFGAARNSPHLIVMACPSMPSPPWEVAAAVAAREALLSDPARPRHDLRLSGIMPPAEGAIFDWSERNTLLGVGMSTFKVISGVVYVERLVTQYQENPQGYDDDALMDIETMRNLAAISYALRVRFAVKYATAKLAADGTKFGAGQLVLTPSIARSEVYGLFRQWELNGQVQDFDSFKSELIIEIDPNIAGRLNILLPPKLIDQLRVTAARIAFKK